MAQKLSEPFVIERKFQAPRSLVFAALTEAEHLAVWMSPPGMELSNCAVDLRVNGTFHYGMRPKGSTSEAVSWGKWTYLEIAPPERLVVVVQFSDAQGGVSRHPMAPDWPLYTLSTTTLTEDNGVTTMHLDWRALDATTEEEAIFAAAHESMSQGWGGTMDALAAYLDQLQRL